MPRRVSLVVLLGIVIVVVLSFGISAAAAPNDIIVPEDVTVPVDSTVPVTVPPGDNVPGEGAVTPAETATPAPVAVPVETTTPPAPVDPQVEGAVPDQGAAPKDSAQGEVTTAQEKTASTSEGTASEENTATEENAASEEDASPEDKAAPADNATESVESGHSETVEPEEAGQDFEDMLKEAEAADGAYKNALSEEKRLNNEITKTRADLAGAEDSLQEAQGSLEDRASQIYKHGQDGFMSVLLEAKDFRQFANLLGSWIQVLEKDQKEVQSWRDSKDALDQKTKELEAQLQSWKTTREETATKKEQAQTSLEGAQNFFDSLDKEAQKEIEKQRASDAALALDHAEKLLQEPAQDKPSAQEAEQLGNKTAEDNQVSQASSEKPDDTVESKQGHQDETGKADEMPPEEQQARQVKVAQAVADTIREWPAIKEQVQKQAGQGSEEAAQQPVVMEKATEGNQNPAAKQLATAAEDQAAAQDQARQAAEQAATEKQATEEAATRAADAEKAKQAAEQAPAAEQEKAQATAQEAERQAGLAADQAAKEKQTAVDTAKQAAQRLASAKGESNAAQTAAEQAAANNPLTPKSGVAGTKPLPGGATGGGVLGEAKTWLGVPYDYSHMAGETRAAVDCSAFTAAVFAKFGIILPDSPVGQFGMGTPVSGDPKAGDLVFFSEDGSGVPTHVGIANGDGTLTHASDFYGEVSVTPMKYIKGYIGARRLL